MSESSIPYARSRVITKEGAMIYCKGCKTEITPEHTFDDIGYPITVCPNNPSHEFEEMSRCKQCGNPAPLYEMYWEPCKQMFRDAIHGQVTYFSTLYGFDRQELKRLLSEIAEE